MQAMLDVQSPSASASDPGPAPAQRAERVGFWLFASHLFGIFGIALSNILLAVSVLAAPRTVRRPLELRELAPLLVPLGLYVLLLAAAIAASYQPRDSLRGLTEVFNLSTLLLAPLLVRGEKDVRRLVDGLLMIAALSAAYGLGQYLFGYGDLDRRIRGTFSHYMTFAGFLLICDLLLLASMTFSDRWRQPWRWVALAAVNVALVGSYTRGAWVALGFAVTALLIVRAPRLLLAYVPAAVLFILLAPVPLLQRVGSIADLRDSSNYDRLCMASAGLTMIQERPLFGIGPEGVKHRYAIYRPATAPRYQVPHLHNSFLNLAAERGLPALASYLALTLVSAGLAWRRYVREGGRHGPRADLWMGVLLALFAFNVAGLFENNWGDTEVQRPLLFVLALPFCLLAGGREREEAEAGEAPVIH
ncbi:MAG TPA: O-antigen ligase family protein [Thermoanaerobaculia bacterium]|nr:O-antigen ligase family protein [Thermoanaerobaculia bacterium]